MHLSIYLVKILFRVRMCPQRHRVHETAEIVETNKAPTQLIDEVFVPLQIRVRTARVPRALVLGDRRTSANLLEVFTGLR